MGINCMQLQLRALSHPEADSAQHLDYQKLVHWLEDRKIRFYPAEGRSMLASNNKGSWHLAFNQVGHACG